MILASKTRKEDAKPFTRLSIRTIIITVFVVQVFIVGYFTAYLSFKNNAKTSDVLIDRSLQEVNSKILSQINSYFEPPVEINNLNESLINSGQVNINKQSDILNQFSLEIKARNSVNSISFANNQGGIANAGIDKPLNNYYVIYTDKFQSGKFYKYAIDNNNEKTHLITQLPYFDARLRPWYTNALSSSGVVWSDVYTIATGNDLGVTASKAVRDKQDNLLGVVCVDLFLSDISTYLSNLDLGVGGNSFIVGKSGYLIATSNHDKLFSIDNTKQIRTRIKAVDSESGLIKTVSLALLGKETNFNSINQDVDLNVEFNNDTYLVHVKPFKAIPATKWLVVTAIPKTSYMSLVYPNNRITLFLIMLELFLSVILAIVLARMISKPILNLNNKVQAISRGDIQSEPNPSRIKEIDELAIEIYQMKDTIQSNIEILNNEISDRKQTETFLQAIIDNNPISIQIVDKNGYTLKSNAANAKLFGMAPPPDFCVFDDFQIKKQGQEDLLQRAKNGEVVYLPDMYYNIHDFNPNLPDNPIWVKVVIFPIIGVGGKPERFVLMHEDITKRKQVEDALIAAKESAEENNRLKSSFLANMSHELRTPLSGILGFSELLKDQIQEEVKRDMVNMISKSGNRLLNTLNLILDLSQLEANMQKVNLSVFNLNNLLNNIIDLFQPIAYKKGITLSFYPEKQELFLSSDFYMLEHIMNELVSNAIKYTNTGSVVVSSRATYINKESHVIIEVTDTGIGISKDNQQVIFDAFRQVSEGWNRSFEGTGLGLTICKKYVNLLGGELALLSEIDKGSQFTLNFPVEVLKKTEQEVKPNNLPDSISLSPSASATAPVNLPQVLLVDDDTMCNLLVSKMLQDIVNLDYATTGTEGLEFIENTNYAAVLLDINLKTGLSGLDVLARIKENDKHKDIPIIALTAYAMLDDKENLLAQGFTDYISKPFTINILTSTIQKWIKV